MWYCCDNLLINIPARVFQKESGFALTNPYILSGAPFLADINLAGFYPGNILFWFFENPFRALTIAIIIHFFVAFTGMYALTKNILSAIVFTFSGALVTYTNNLPMLQVASLLPWVFWAWNKNLILFVFFASLQIFAGYAQFMYYTWLLLVFWSIWFLRQRRIRLWRRPKNMWPRLVAVSAVAIITSIQVVPFLQVARESTRASFGYEYAVFDSLNPLATVRLFIPWSVGILNQGTAWVMGGSVYGYVGVLPIIFAAVASRRKPIVRFFLVIAVASFFLALGKYNPLYPVLIKIIPGLGSFRSPQHFLLLWTFAISILAGFGVERRKTVRTWFAWVAGAMIFAAFVAPFITIRQTPPQIRSLIVQNSAISAIMLSLLYKYPTRFFVSLFLFIDLFLFTRSNIITLPQSTVNSWLEKSAQVAQKIESDGKMYVHRDLYAAPIQKQFGKFDWPGEAAWQVAILRPNINMLYHLASIDGYAAVVSNDYQKSFGVAATDPTGVNMGEITGEKLLLWGVDSVLAPTDPKYIEKLFPLVLSDWLGNMAIYRVARK